MGEQGFQNEYPVAIFGTCVSVFPCGKMQPFLLQDKLLSKMDCQPAKRSSFNKSTNSEKSARHPAGNIKYIKPYEG